LLGEPGAAAAFATTDATSFSLSLVGAAFVRDMLHFIDRGGGEHDAGDRTWQWLESGVLLCHFSDGREWREDTADQWDDPPESE
jgi:hypothetical protein